MFRYSSLRLTGIKALAFAGALCLLSLFAASARPAYSQTMDYERQRARAMLNAIKDDIRKNYYDPSFRGIDLEARFKKADEEIKTATALR